MVYSLRGKVRRVLATRDRFGLIADASRSRAAFFFSFLSPSAFLLSRSSFPKTSARNDSDGQRRLSLSAVCTMNPKTRILVVAGAFGA